MLEESHCIDINLLREADHKCFHFFLPLPRIAFPNYIIQNNIHPLSSLTFIIVWEGCAVNSFNQIQLNKEEAFLLRVNNYSDVFLFSLDNYYSITTIQMFVNVLYLNNMDSFNSQIGQIHLEIVNDLLSSKPIQQVTLNTAQLLTLYTCFFYLSMYFLFYHYFIYITFIYLFHVLVTCSHADL